jgi:hypothetical protein
MKQRACPERLNFSRRSGKTLRSSAMMSSARVCLLAAAMAVGGFFASPAHALTATALPALLNQGQEVAKPVEQVGYRHYYHRPYRKHYRRHYYPRRHYVYRPYYRRYAYSYPYYYDDDYDYGYPYAYGGYPYAYGGPVVGLSFGWGGPRHWGGGHWGHRRW